MNATDRQLLGEFDLARSYWPEQLQLLRQCLALSKVYQSKPNIFIFDRDNPEIIPKVCDGVKPYKAWGNNVFSFAIPIPDHRSDLPGASIELYFNDRDLGLPGEDGRRIFLSNEFNPSSGRHLSDANLSAGHKGKLSAGRAGIKILDTEVYDAAHKNVALSKAEFASLIANGSGAFESVDFQQFKKVFSIVEQIARPNSIDLLFGGMDDLITQISQLSKPEKLATIVEAAIRICKLSSILFAGLTIRFYDPASEEKFGIDQKKLRPIRQTVIENFATPSLSTLVRTARSCYHLIDDRAPDQLQNLRGMMAENPVLDSIGDLLDDIERIVPPDGRRGRTIIKRNTKKPLLEYVFPELAKYEARIAEIRNSESDVLDEADDSTWVRAVTMLVGLLKPLEGLAFRAGNIIRLQADSDKFVVRLATYRNGRATTEEVHRDYADVSGDRLDTYEINASHDGDQWLDIYPFITIKDERVHFYTRTRSVGFQYIPVFGPSVHVESTKRRFSHAALDGTIAADRQMLFWARVAPAISAAGVRANIPPHDPTDFVGRKQQIATIMDEVIQIPNENGLLHGPGGVGKTALLIELSRKLFEEGQPSKAPFKNMALRGKRLIKAWVRCWYEFEIYWFLMFSAG
jgi:hypothetical protein